MASEEKRIDSLADDLHEVKNDVHKISTDLASLNTKFEESVKHMNYRMDTMSSVRMWVITFFSIVAGAAGAIKIFEALFNR